MKWVKSDGGRAEAGYKGFTGDCAVRAIAIATGQDYADVYRDLRLTSEWYRDNKRDKVARLLAKKGATSPRNGVYREVMDAYLADLGWQWVPTMGIGTGTTMHMRAIEVPHGTIIVRLSKHFAAVINGTVYDTHDCRRGGFRAVYGYWKEAHNGGGDV